MNPSSPKNEKQKIMSEEKKVENFIQRVAQEYDGLSKQLKGIARFLTENRRQMVVVRIREVADQCHVQPSAVVRFAQHFGFSGFSDLQALFREAYASTASTTSYQQRIRTVISTQPAKMKSSDLARSFLDACQSGIGAMSESLDAPAFEKAVDILQKAQHIYVMGVRRMFPVSSYLAYVLAQAKKRVILVDSIGGMYKQQIESLSKGDVLISISMQPYGEETHYSSDLAVERGATIVAITDIPLSPIAKQAAAVLTVQETEAYYFRAIACTMSLAQSLFIALAYRIEQPMGRRSKKVASATKTAKE